LRLNWKSYFFNWKEVARELKKVQEALGGQNGKKGPISV
jgi:hypothetical protein